MSKGRWHSVPLEQYFVIESMLSFGLVCYWIVWCSSSRWWAMGCLGGLGFGSVGLWGWRVDYLVEYIIASSRGSRVIYRHMLIDICCIFHNSN